MTINHTYSSGGLALTKTFEGLRLKAYRDSGGVLTIGYGHTGQDVHPGMVITEAQAEALLVKDVQAAVNAVNRLVTAQIGQNQFDALVDFTFNLGEGALARSAEQFLKWVYVGNQVVAGLLRRRQAERELFNKHEVGK